MRLDHAFERGPRHHRCHLGKEHVTLRALLLRRKVERREAQLVHGVHPSNQWHYYAILAGLIRGSLVKPYQFKCIEGRAFEMFCGALLYSIQSMNMHPASMKRYLGLLE